MRRRLGASSVLGGITVIPLMIAFVVTGFGEPGTAAYETYERLNRLMAVSLLLMSVGWLGARLEWPSGYGRWAASVALIGSLTMVAGNVAEFWLFTDLPYGVTGNGRDLSWMAFSLGSLVMDIGVTCWVSRSGVHAVGPAGALCFCWWPCPWPWLRSSQSRRSWCRLCWQW